ncbi:MAG: sigma-70 family RNA polymerase sigma factor [Acidimicrobiia bacterium]
MDELTRLALAARDGDRLALGGFVRRSQGEVWRLVASLVGRDDADDVTQDVYVRAWRALPGFRGDSSARTWLLVIARRSCADAVRGRVRRRHLLRRARTEASVATHHQPDGASEHALEALVEGLDADRREAFVLTQLLGCSYEEAADVCRVPVGTIRSRVARARVDLVAAVRAAEATG